MTGSPKEEVPFGDHGKGGSSCCLSSSLALAQPFQRPWVCLPTLALVPPPCANLPEAAGWLQKWRRKGKWKDEPPGGRALSASPQ